MGARAVLLAAIAPAVYLAGCAETPRTSATERARASVEVFLEACAAGEGTRAIGTLTEPARETFLGGTDVAAGCRYVLGLPSAASGSSTLPFAGAEVRSVAVGGGFGEARVALPGAAAEQRIRLEETGGRWLLASESPAAPETD